MKPTNPINGAIIYEGPSLLDGSPIVMIATGLVTKSRNSKTGNMIQTWILRSDIAPKAAQDSGADESVCGGCPLRPAIKKPGDPKCYVATWQAPLVVWKAFKRGHYPVADNRTWKTLRGRVIRIGSYGDPGAVPGRIGARLVRAAGHHTGYSHQWETNSALTYAMASVETPLQRTIAKAKGFRTFRTRRAGDPLLAGEISCPASKEAGQRTTCENCRLCGGDTVKAKDISIIIH